LDPSLPPLHHLPKFCEQSACARILKAHAKFDREIETQEALDRERRNARLKKYTNFVFNLAMKNITVTLDEQTAAWARVYAAQRNMSVSRFLGELLHEKMRESREYERSMERFLAIKPKNLSGGTRYPRRDEIHDR